ncbi:MAG: glycosyltransferase family 87 protein [Planctomycetaceae bacterium]
MKHARRSVSLIVVLTCVVGTMAVGTALKAPCASGAWQDGRQYRWLCYTDVVPLVGTEQLAGGRLPFLDPCVKTDNNCDEYPVLTMYFMRAAAWIGGTGYQGFFYTNALLLTACAAAIAVCLWLLVGRRALWFALAPTLLVYGTVNWDLFAVALATGALVAFAARREGWAGILLGLGAAAKFYPALLVLPLFLQGLQDREPDRAIRVLWWSAGAWVAVNLPFALAAPSGWWEFFRFNAARIPDFDSLWFIACRHTDLACITTRQVNVASGLLFVAIVAVAWRWRRRRTPGFPRWTLGFPILVAFLLTNKVYSPQYGLWLLPWFALALPDLKRYVAFEVADVGVFVTRFWFFGTYTGVMALPQQWWFEVAVLARTLVLVWCLIGWIRRAPEPNVLDRRGWEAPTVALPAPPQGLRA